MLHRKYKTIPISIMQELYRQETTVSCTRVSEIQRMRSGNRTESAFIGSPDIGAYSMNLAKRLTV